MHFFQTVVRVWFRVLGKDSSPHRKLTFLYLANDVVQNSKKKFPEYAKEFGTVIKKVIEHLAGITMDEKVVKSIGRLLNIWKERTIFDGKIQNEMSRIWATKALEVKAASGTDTEKAAGSIKRKSSGETQNLFSVRVEVKVLKNKHFCSRALSDKIGEEILSSQLRRLRGILRSLRWHRLQLRPAG